MWLSLSPAHQPKIGFGHQKMIHNSLVTFVLIVIFVVALSWWDPQSFPGHVGKISEMSEVQSGKWFRIMADRLAAVRWTQPIFCNRAVSAYFGFWTILIPYKPTNFQPSLFPKRMQIFSAILLSIRCPLFYQVLRATQMEWTWRNAERKLSQWSPRSARFDTFLHKFEL